MDEVACQSLFYWEFGKVKQKMPENSQNVLFEEQILFCEEWILFCEEWILFCEEWILFCEEIGYFNHQICISITK